MEDEIWIDLPDDYVYPQEEWQTVTVIIETVA